MINKKWTTLVFFGVIAVHLLITLFSNDHYTAEVSFKTSSSQQEVWNILSDYTNPEFYPESIDIQVKDSLNWDVTNKEQVETNYSLLSKSDQRFLSYQISSDKKKVDIIRSIELSSDSLTTVKIRDEINYTSFYGKWMYSLIGKDSDTEQFLKQIQFTIGKTKKK